MKSSLTVQITFSYKGVTYSPSARIELDSFLENNETVPEFYQIVARENHIDPYSYEYEVMQLGQFNYLAASGLAQQFCHEDEFDMAGFKACWERAHIEQKLAEIALKQMSIADLDDNQDLKQALLQAYHLGAAKG